MNSDPPGQSTRSRSSVSPGRALLIVLLGGLVFSVCHAGQAANPSPAQVTQLRAARAGESVASLAKPEADAGETAGDAELAEPEAESGQPNPEAPGASGQRTELNLLGEVDSSSGESRRNENVRITLIDNNVLKELNKRMGTTATIFEEFLVDRDYFGKEFGGQPKAPVHLTPSRATDIHGNAYWSHDNSIFSARSFFQVGDVQPARTNDYGISVGLPLWRTARLTLDGSQRKVRGQVNGNILVPAPDERTPLTDDPATREIVERILGAYPDELPNRTDINPRALNTNALQAIDDNRVGATLDTWLDKDRLSLSYNLTLQDVEAFQLVGGQNPDTTTKNHRVRVTWGHEWTAATTTDFSVGYDRISSLLVPEETSIGPFFVSGRGLAAIGPSQSIPIDRVQNMFRYGARVRHVRGRHLWSAGTELLRRQVNGVESSGHRGTFSFGEDFEDELGQTRSVMTNIRMGTPSGYSVSIGNVHRGFRNWDMQYFVGDDWRVNSNLTLNLGLRYQPVTRPSEVNGLSEFPYRCDCNNLAPRFGFAYRLSDRWGVLRGAYGVHYGEIFPATFGQARFNPPGNLLVKRDAPYLPDPLRDLEPSDFDPSARSSIFELDPDLVAPYSHQYNFSWQLGSVDEWQLELGYVGSRSHRLLTTWHLNRARPVEGIDRTTSTINERRPDQRFFEIRRILNGSRGYFDAAKVTLSIPRWKGLTLDASYWFSKAIDLGGDYTNTASGRDSSRSRSRSGFDYHGEMRGLSSFDQPHAFLWRFNYETPLIGGPSGWIRKILGQWQISSIVLLKSGTPFGVRAGSDSPGFGNVDGARGDTPILLDPSILGRTIDHPDTSAKMLPASAFGFMKLTDPRGNLGRNVFRKDGVWNINAALSRRWTLGGEKALLLRVESLNFLNAPQFEEPGHSLSNDEFGQITNTLNDGRAFTLSLRYTF